MNEAVQRGAEGGGGEYSLNENASHRKSDFNKRINICTHAYVWHGSQAQNTWKWLSVHSETFFESHRQMWQFGSPIKFRNVTNLAKYFQLFEFSATNLSWAEVPMKLGVYVCVCVRCKCWHLHTPNERQTKRQTRKGREKKQQKERDIEREKREEQKEHTTFAQHVDQKDLEQKVFGRVAELRFGSCSCL